MVRNHAGKPPAFVLPRLGAADRCPLRPCTLCLDGEERCETKAQGQIPGWYWQMIAPRPTRNQHEIRRRLGSSSSSASARRKAPHHRLAIKGRHRHLAEDPFVTLPPRCKVPTFSPLNTA